MRPEVIATAVQLFDIRLKQGITVKPPGKKKEPFMCCCSNVLLMDDKPSPNSSPVNTNAISFSRISPHDTAFRKRKMMYCPGLCLLSRQEIYQ